MSPHNFLLSRWFDSGATHCLTRNLMINLFADSASHQRLNSYGLIFLLYQVGGWYTNEDIDQNIEKRGASQVREKASF